MKEIKTKKNYRIPDNLLFFDIETTGLSARTSYVYLIGFMTNENGTCFLNLLLCEDFNEEKELLIKFSDILKKSRKTPVTYNGNTFDIPYLNEKFKRHQINFFIDTMNTIDCYKTLIGYKKLFDISDLKLVTVEKKAGYTRENFISGEDLINVYAELTGLIRLYEITKREDVKEKINALEFTLLSHNSDDIEGLFCIYEKTNILSAKEFLIKPEISVSETEITLTYPVPLFPCETEFNFSNFYLFNGKTASEIVIPIINTEFKYFFKDYKNYTYIASKDMCMHNSVVTGLPKEEKTKCTREDAYIKKQDMFLFVPKNFIDYACENRIPLFKANYDSKEFYMLKDYFKNHSDEYIKSILNEIK